MGHFVIWIISKQVIGRVDYVDIGYVFVDIDNEVL